jgi:hypothetical protein
MTVEDYPPVPEIIPPPRPNPVVRFLRRFTPKKGLLNRLAVGALEAADVVLGSMMIAEVPREIKEVVLIAIKKD